MERLDPRQAIVRVAAPEAGGAVMATGILSVAMRNDAQRTVSLILLAITALAWVVLGAVSITYLLSEPSRWLERARSPSSLTAVAGTAVLGTRLTLFGSEWAGWALLGVTAGLCLALLTLVARAAPLPRTGGAFLVVVALQSLAVLAALQGIRAGVEWPVLAALAPFLLGLTAYPIVLARFKLTELRTGMGDHWVSGGALAISTLACAQIARGLAFSGALHEVHDVLRIAAFVLWGLTLAWLPLLIGAEVRWPRLRYDVRRWATVFPLGMYAAMSFVVGRAGAASATAFADVWAWVALAGWVGVSLGLLRHGLLAGAHGRDAAVHPAGPGS